MGGKYAGMKINPKKLDLGITTLNVGFWLWAVSHMKQHGDHLGGPHLIALIALMVSVFICYRALLAGRRVARSSGTEPSAA